MNTMILGRIRTGRPCIPVLAGLLALCLLATPAAANGPPVTDGDLGEWSGHARIADGADGGIDDRGDLTGFAWGTNDGEGTMYFMLERVAGAMNSATYGVFLDMNNNGAYGEGVDRIVTVEYDPGGRRASASSVRVHVLNAATSAAISTVSGQDWGETQTEGQRRVEFKATFASLGHGVGNAVRMYAQTLQNDRAPNSGDIQWSPVPAIGYPLLMVLVAVGIGAAHRGRLRRTWRRR